MSTYTAVVILLSKFNVEMKQSARTRMLAAAWARYFYFYLFSLISMTNFNSEMTLYYQITC